MDTFKKAPAALIAEWKGRRTPAEEIALALEVALLSIEDEIAEMDE